MSDNKPLSIRESELAVLAWRALEDAKIDYNKLADVAGFKNGQSARSNFGPIRKKLLEGGYTASATGTTTPKGKRNAAAAVEGLDDSPTPTKKPRGRASKKVVAPALTPAPAKEEEMEKEDEDDEEEVAEGAVA